MNDRFEYKRRPLKERRQGLVQEFELVNRQLMRAIDPVICKRLEDELAVIEEKINQIDLQLQRLDSTPINAEHDNQNVKPNRAAESEKSTESLFQINYQLVHPYVMKGDDDLVQTLVSFSNRKDVDKPTRKIQTHLYLILDVSGSMNTPDKYPLLHQAIPVLVEALSDEDYLTIILFSYSCDTVLYNALVRDIRDDVEELLTRIDHSGVMFGPGTLLAPALQEAISGVTQFRQTHPFVVNRLYILTDGELHDAEACLALNAGLRTLESEIHSYGFGPKFALESMRGIMKDIHGGTVKPIFNTSDVQSTFGHIGDLAQRIIAQDAHFTFIFSSGIIPGDAFRYQPGTQYFGSVDSLTKKFEVTIGPLEEDRVYTFAFEGRLPKSANGTYLKFGNAELEYRTQGDLQSVIRDLYVERVSSQSRAKRSRKRPQEIFQVLEAFRNNDPQAQLESLRARLKIYQRESTDPVLVDTVKRAITKLERGESLNEDELRGLKADKGTFALGR